MLDKGIEGGGVSSRSGLGKYFPHSPADCVRNEHRVCQVAHIHNRSAHSLPRININMQIHWHTAQCEYIRCCQNVCVSLQPYLKLLLSARCLVN